MDCTPEESTPARDAPAFDLYPSDWLAGTLLMSYEEKGLYIDLLCLQWQHGALPPDAALKRLRVKAATLASVLEKFPAGEDGLRRNPRLEREREKQRHRIARSRAGAAATNAKRWGGRLAGDSPAESLSDTEASRSATAERVADDSPPPPPPQIGEREHAARARGLVDLYPRRDAPAECQALLLEALETGNVAPEEIERGVRLCVERIEAAPGGSSNRYVPSAKKFWTEQQWRSPEAFDQRWKGGRNGALPEEPKLTTAPSPKGW